MVDAERVREAQGRLGRGRHAVEREALTWRGRHTVDVERGDVTWWTWNAGRYAAGTSRGGTLRGGRRLRMWIAGSSGARTSFGGDDMRWNMRTSPAGVRRGMSHSGVRVGVKMRPSSPERYGKIQQNEEDAL